jgi:hypothetical protein
MLFDEVENVLVLKGDVKPSWQTQILILERSSAMFFLILNVSDDRV